MVKWIAVGSSALLLLFAVASGIVSAAPNQQRVQSLVVERSEDRQSATATWTPIPGAEHQFFVYFGMALLGEKDVTGLGIHLGTYKEVILTGSDDSLAISELDPRREYSYAVARADRDSEGSWVWSGWAVVGSIRPSPTTSVTDREALVALYNATGGANWRDSANWLSDAPLDDWYGVKTDSDGRVVEISLWANNLRGQIPSDLGNLARLERLNLFMNRLNGEIPSELGMLSNLEELILMGNQLTGQIPSELGGLLNMRKLLLSAVNQFTGCIPSALRNVAENDLSELELQFCP